MISTSGPDVPPSLQYDNKGTRTSDAGNTWTYGADQHLGQFMQKRLTHD